MTPATVETKPADPTDDVVATKHHLRVGRKTLDYTATTGRVVLREEVYEDGKFTGFKAKAEMSMTSYVVDGAPENRPVTFAFNGGPGSSSVWLHLGLLGPRRVVMGDVGALLPPPYELADNAESLLAVSDLVFIDPVSTGYSRAVEGTKPEPFHGYQGDIESVGELIRMWTSRHKRWMSPKFVAGESYGTTARRGPGRAPPDAVRDVPQRADPDLQRARLRSLDFENQSNDRAHALYLPTYAAIAHYHGKHPRKSLKAVLKEAEEYAARDYPWVLSRGDRLTAKERAAAVRKLAVADRADRGLRRPGRPAHRALAVLRRAAARPAAHDGPPRRPLHRSDGQRDRRGDGRRPVARRDLRALRRRVQPLRARRARLRERPALRADLPRACSPWSFKDFEGRPIDVTPQAGAGDAGQPAPQGARRLRLLRRRHAALRGRGRHRPPAACPTSCARTSSTATTRPGT